MKTAVILAAGDGTRIWPHAVLRPKSLIPIANKPLVTYTVDILEELAFERIIIAAGRHGERIRNCFSRRPTVEVVSMGPADSGGRVLSSGTALTLANAAAGIAEDFLVLYGDAIVAGEDVEKPIDAHESPCALVYSLGEESSRDWVCCSVDDGRVQGIAGHPRGGFDYRFAAFALSPRFLPYLEANSGIFTDVQVGMMPPREAYLEMSLADYLREGNTLRAVIGEGCFIDIDKPWHILMANRMMTTRICRALGENRLDDGASIDPTASRSAMGRSHCRSCSAVWVWVGATR